MDGRIYIARMFIQSSGRYQPQFNRPYVAECDASTLDDLGRRIDQVTRMDPKAKVGGSLIAGMSTGLIVPSAETHYQLEIPNGWDNERLRFLLEVHVDTPFGLKVYFFNGYSEHNGLSSNGLSATIDPRMPFHINSFIAVSRMEDYTGTSPTGYNDTIVESAHVVNGRFHSDHSTRPVYGTRPFDLFTGVQSVYLREAYQNFEGSTVIDDRIDQANSVTKSSRSNSIPSTYLAKVIDTYRSAQTLADFGNGQDDIYNRAIQSSYENDPFENDFIRAINNLYGQMGMTSFTIEDLESLDPGCVRDRVKYHEIAQGFPVHQPGDSESWQGSSLDQQAATIIGHGVSALMLDSMLIQMGFTYSNRLVGGGEQALPIEDTIQGITSADMRLYINNFLRRFCEEVMPDVTRNGMIGVDLTVYADLFGDTRIDISIEGGPPVPFIIPQFADALRVPTITTDNNVYNGLITGVEEIISTVSNTGQHLPNYIVKDI